jgi:hypothetical protein
MREEIENELSVLVGLPLWIAGRVADLEWFHFGQPHTVVDRKGKPKEVGDYALHIQCGWRVVKDDCIIVGSRDLYYPPNGLIDVPEDFDWDVQNGNWRDVRMKAFLQEYAGAPLIVSSVIVSGRRIQ